MVDSAFHRTASHGSPLLVFGGNPRILVVDDDPSFGRILARQARIGGVALAFFQSLDELRGKLSRWRFDAAVLDSDLGDESGVEAARYLERYLLNLPVLLVSQSDLDVPPKEKWPSSVRQFLLKSVGHERILEEVVRLAGKKGE
jgi:DNA-binding response OmpR family regulator